MKRKVCIIDDDDDVREVMTFALEESGFEVWPFENPEEALESMNESKEYPGFFLLDYYMPKMNGINFIKKLRADYQDTLGRIPCALSTATDETPEKIPDDVLELKKPVDLDHLLDIIHSHCL